MKNKDCESSGNLQNGDQNEHSSENQEEGNSSVQSDDRGEDTNSLIPGESVRGSGFTYDEEKGRTDKSIPIKDNRDVKVKLPDLGPPNRP